jgi:hypothetical protein
MRRRTSLKAAAGATMAAGCAAALSALWNREAARTERELTVAALRSVKTGYEAAQLDTLPAPAARYFRTALVHREAASGLGAIDAQNLTGAATALILVWLAGTLRHTGDRRAFETDTAAAFDDNCCLCHNAGTKTG